MKRIKATEDEKTNGWTDESLHEYRRERERSQFKAVFYNDNVKKPTVQNHRYSPFKWGK